jgi:hypothetical protein
MTFCNYPQFATQYSTMYNQYLSTTAIINKIQSTVRGNVNQYIATKMSNILPPSALTRQQFTDPLQFRILWLSALVAPQLQFIDNWGLGYNLGFSKLDTPYGTVIRAQSFYKIIDDYIYLQMSPEYDINRLDFGGIEDSRVTQDTTGAIKTYYGKLLLNNFNTISQTLVHNPVTLTPALGKLDSLTFSWMEFGGAVIANSNCDWNISIQIQEEVSQAGSLVPATTGF